MTSFATLRNLVRDARPVERCDLCRVVLAPQHRHLLDLSSRKLVCSCDACTLLFPGRGGQKYKLIPRDTRFLRDFELTAGQWESLLIPIGLAFFYRSSADGRVLAFYPSPAGPTESMLALEAWDDIVAGCPAVVAMEPDVEALLVNRLPQPAEYYLTPIDQCYQLAGLIRKNWHGLSGGTALWDRIREFFTELKEHASA